MQHIFKMVWISFSLISYFINGYAQRSMEMMSDREVYELLLIRYDIYQEYRTIEDVIHSLRQEATRYAGQGDYHLARLYLEEALDQIKTGADSSHISGTPIQYISMVPVSEKRFDLMVTCGIDFNRQEFEIGYLDNDSTVLEEINKPFIDLTAWYPLYRTVHHTLDIANSIRFDRLNLRDEYQVRWKSGKWFNAAVGGFWNRSDELEANSFWEHNLEVSLFRVESPSFIWRLRENYIHKSYKEKQIYLADFYRNRFNAGLEWMIADPMTLGFEYFQDLNESLGSENMDYFQNSVLVRGNGYMSKGIEYGLSLNGLLRDYSIQYEDSIIDNRYTEWDMEGTLHLQLTDLISLGLVDNLSRKIYAQKSTLEPDYVWNYFRPSVTFLPFQDLEVGIGYEWEFRDHFLVADEAYDVNEQDYRANGLFLNVGINTAKGLFITGSVSYQWRRYASSITNEILSIYSDRDVVSVFLTAFIPISKHLSINAFAAYDTDKDIDLDQQNNQSVIFNMEVGYTF